MIAPTHGTGRSSSSAGDSAKSRIRGSSPGFHGPSDQIAARGLPCFERSIIGRVTAYEQPPDSLAATLLGAKDAISAAQEARQNSSRRNPTVLLSSPDVAGRGSAFGRRRTIVAQVGWDAQIWDAYYQAFISHLGPLDIGLIVHDSGPPSLSVVDLRQWEPRPDIAGRYGEPVVSIRDDAGWRRRSKFRRALASLFGL
ncbi:MAG TPA: hypothetical protein VN758_05155 [Solirubrobacterales bacterium]|nr:hypothetical protein [Solirubrobacterales bacterium]